MGAHDLPEPSREGGRLAQILQAVECREKGILDGVLGQVTIFDNDDSEVHGVAAESVNEHGNGGVIPPGTSGQEFLKQLRHWTSIAGLLRKEPCRRRRVRCPGALYRSGGRLPGDRAEGVSAHLLENDVHCITAPPGVMSALPSPPTGSGRS
jgi:hypothetical protein